MTGIWHRRGLAGERRRLRKATAITQSEILVTIFEYGWRRQRLSAISYDSFCYHFSVKLPNACGAWCCQNALPWMSSQQATFDWSARTAKWPYHIAAVGDWGDIIITSYAHWREVSRLHYGQQKISQAAVNQSLMNKSSYIIEFRCVQHLADDGNQFRNGTLILFRADLKISSMSFTSVKCNAARHASRQLPHFIEGRWCIMHRNWKW